MYRTCKHGAVAPLQPSPGLVRRRQARAPLGAANRYGFSLALPRSLLLCVNCCLSSATFSCRRPFENTTNSSRRPLQCNHFFPTSFLIQPLLPDALSPTAGVMAQTLGSDAGVESWHHVRILNGHQQGEGLARMRAGAHRPQARRSRPPCLASPAVFDVQWQPSGELLASCDLAGSVIVWTPEGALAQAPCLRSVSWPWRPSPRHPAPVFISSSQAKWCASWNAARPSR